MNTDACNVEDINILHIKECLLLSCVASLENWFCLFHTFIIHPVQEWSGFCRHVWFFDGVRVHIIVINNKSVRVLCEQTGWLLTSLPVVTSTNWSAFHSWEDHFSPAFPFWVVWWASAHYKSRRSWLLLIPRAQKYLTFMFCFLLAFWSSRSKNIKSPFAASRDQSHHRFRLCCDSFFTWIFLHSFRHHHNL